MNAQSDNSLPTYCTAAELRAYAAGLAEGQRLERVAHMCGEAADRWAAKYREARATVSVQQETIRLRTDALREAATSLRTLAELAGRDEYLADMLQVRGYAANRANVADAALKEQG